MFWFVTFFVILILIGLNALYVAAEFSTVSSRKARLSKMAAEGQPFASVILHIVEDPHRLDAYVATCQVGITISSLVLGYFGQSRLTEWISPMFERLGGISPLAANSMSATTILIVLSLFQILLGELVPKNIGLQFPEKLATMTALPMRWSSKIFKPLIWLFNGSGVLLMRWLKIEFGAEHTHLHSPEEIEYLIEESNSAGVLKQEEGRLLKNTLRLRQAMIRKLMIPRARMLAAPSSLTVNQLLQLVSASPYSRVPIFKETVDKIIGVIHLRDLLCSHVNGSKKPITNYIHPVPFIPETMRVKDVFSLLQRKHFQVAIVLDEFGGTAGMVTLEDLLEEIFGDLKDEFDRDISLFQILPNNRIWISGEMLLAQANEMFHFDFPDSEFDTIGGLFINTIGHVPIVNDEIKIKGNEFRVEKMSGRGVAAVSFQASRQLISELTRAGK